jgi:hypothetical protein
MIDLGYPQRSTSGGNMCFVTVQVHVRGTHGPVVPEGCWAEGQHCPTKLGIRFNLHEFCVSIVVIGWCWISCSAVCTEAIMIIVDIERWTVTVQSIACERCCCRLASYLVGSFSEPAEAAQ